MNLESLANRVCALECESMTLVGDEQCDLDAVKFTFMLWDHTACGVRMGCLQSGVDELLFIVSYDSPVNGKRLFMGQPWLDCGEKKRVIAPMASVDRFLQEVRKTNNLNANVVFDGDLAVDRSIGLHLCFDQRVDGKALLVKDVAECENILFVIEMFE